MNNENKNLADLYGTEVNTTDDNNSVNNQNTNTNIESTPIQNTQSVEKPQLINPQPIENNTINNQTIINNEPNKMSSPKKTGNPIILLLIIIIICFGIYKIFIDGKDSSLKDKYNIINKNPEDQKKAEMIKIFKGYTTKINSYVDSRSYSCGTFLRPTSFGIEIDTSIGNSIAQKNGALLMNSNEKSPWDNKDIKGYIYVDQHSSYDKIFYINLSDGNYGVTRETDISKITEKDITYKNPYPVIPEKYNKCLLGEEEE